MMTFREKWLPALGLALILHIIVISIVYFNLDKNHSADPQVDRSAITAKPTANSQTANSKTAQDKTAFKSKVYTTTLTTAKDRSTLATNAEDDLLKNNLLKNDGLKGDVLPSTDTNESLQEEIDIESPVTVRGQSRPAIQTIPIQTKPKTSVQTAMTASDIISSPSEGSVKMGSRAKDDFNNLNGVSSSKTDRGLLAMDKPTPANELNIDEEYVSAQSEVEAINEQLSAAINEVKNRNQRKIEQMQHNRQQSFDESVDGVTRNTDEIK